MTAVRCPVKWSGLRPEITPGAGKFARRGMGSHAASLLGRGRREGREGSPSVSRGSVGCGGRMRGGVCLTDGSSAGSAEPLARRMVPYCRGHGRVSGQSPAVSIIPARYVVLPGWLLWGRHGRRRWVCFAFAAPLAAGCTQSTAAKPRKANRKSNTHRQVPVTKVAQRRWTARSLLPLSAGSLLP